MAGEITLSNGEKLILIMLCELFKALKVQGREVDPEFVESVISGGHLWALPWKYQGIFHGEDIDPAVANEAVNILDMWSFLERSYEQLPEEDKERVAKEAEPYGKRIHFDGFDGNNETEYMSVARFLVEKLDRFSEFEGRDFNAHTPTIEVHRRMYSVFEPIRSTLGSRKSVFLTAPEIIEILKARTHPSHRNVQPIRGNPGNVN